MLLLLLLVTLSTAALAPLRRERGLARAGGGQCAAQLRVQTSNILLGGDLSPLISATSNPADFERVATNFVFTSLGQPGGSPGLDPVRRIGAIARQLIRDNIQVVGIQEAANWTITGFPQLDYLTVLQQTLTALGADYRIAVRRPGFFAIGNISSPLGGGDLTVRFEISDAILVRGDVPYSNPRSGTFRDFIPLPSPLGLLRFRRQWVSLDIALPDAVPVRFFSAQLEPSRTSADVSNDFRARQAREFAGEILSAQNAGFSTIAVGDWNSQISERGDGAQILFTTARIIDAWTASASSDPGFTFGNDATLTSSNFVARIDFIGASLGMYFSDVRTINEPVVPQAGSAGPLFASNHKFVRATVSVPFKK